MLKEKAYSYVPVESPPWVKQKMQVLVNKYFQLRRDVKWLFYKLRNPITIDFGKIRLGSIPIIINNFNRCSLLKTQVEWLLSLPNNISIIIIDNNSTYKPLLDYYRTLRYDNVQVVVLKHNSWNKGILHVAKLLQNFPKYIVTDSDVIPYQDTPSDIISHLSAMLDKYPAYNHVGVSLEIDDIPFGNPLREMIRTFEQRFWLPENKLNDEVYTSLVDTTFAMYRQNSRVFYGMPALRTDRPYTLKHADWYLDLENMSDEYLYYLNTSQSYSSWSTILKEHLAEGEQTEDKKQNLTFAVPQ